MAMKNGMNWIRKDKRLAIYLRDGMACCYCGSVLEDGITLTLEHIQPRSEGGTNHESNLVTACRKCNSSRGNRDQAAFCEAVATYINHGITADDILAHIKKCANTKLTDYRKQAKLIMARRATWAGALNEASK